MGSFQDLVVWQKSIVLTCSIYELTADLPSEEKYGLTSQMRRAAVSIPSNIAEGHGRASKREFARFLSIAIGSLRELQTQLILLRELKLANPEQQLVQCEDIAKMINGLKKSLDVSK